jgi:hypothetical protein
MKRNVAGVLSAGLLLFATPLGCSPDLQRGTEPSATTQTVGRGETESQPKGSPGGMSLSPHVTLWQIVVEYQAYLARCRVIALSGVPKTHGNAI